MREDERYQLGYFENQGRTPVPFFFPRHIGDLSRVAHGVSWCRGKSRRCDIHCRVRDVVQVPLEPRTPPARPLKNAGGETASVGRFEPPEALLRTTASGSRPELDFCPQNISSEKRLPDAQA